MKKNRIKIVLIITVIIICICCNSLLIIYYSYKNQRIHGMEHPMDIANEYMRPRYDGHWKRLDNVFYAGRKNSSRFSADYKQYRVGKAMDDVGSSNFSKSIGKDNMIYCKTIIRGFQIIEISSWYWDSPWWGDGMGIYVGVKFYDGDAGYWDRREFALEYEDGEYIVKEFIHGENKEIPNKAGLEEETGMTMEEILEIVGRQQEDCENMLYEMKEAELKRNKEGLFLGLLLVNGAGLWTVIRKGVKKKLPEALE